MEARKITVVSTQTQKKSVITTSAETLEDLKKDLTAAGICYDGMTFYEGTSRTELIDNRAMLPKEVPYKGTTTNELVFMLTNSNKRIKSGAKSRDELYAEIQKGGVANDIKIRFGKNYTLCTNRDLELFLLARENTPKPKKKVTPAKVAVKEETPEPNKEVAEVKTAINVLVKALYAQGIVSAQTAGAIFQLLNKGTIFKEDGGVSPYSDADIETMFDFISL